MLEHHEGAAKQLINNKKKVGRPKKAADDQSVRVTVTLPRNLANRLEELMKVSGHSSVPDYIRSSLVFYSAAVNQYEKGGSALLRDSEGKYIQLPIALLPHGS